MILALSLILASTPADASLAVKVVSLDFSYPYVGEPGNNCQRSGSVFVRAVANSQPVVVRLVNANGLSPGTEAVLDDVRRAGAGRDGTPVYCSAGIRAPGAPAPVAVVAAQPSAETAPPLVQASPPAVEASQPAADAAPAAETAAPAGEGCVVRLFHVVKKPLDGKKFGPSEFDPDSALNVPETIDCRVARSRNTNVLLLKMVKDGYSKPEAVVGAEWGGSWKKEADAPQQRVVKVYLVDAPVEGSSPTSQR